MKHSILIGLAASTVAMAAFAQSPTSSAPAAGEPTFASLDQNSDGRITTSEATAAKDLSAAFKTADVNGDGALNRTEFDSWKSMPKTTQPGTPGSGQ